MIWMHDVHGTSEYLNYLVMLLDIVVRFIISPAVTFWALEWAINGMAVPVMVSQLHL